MKKFRILEVKHNGKTKHYLVQNQRRILWIKWLTFWSNTWYFNGGTADYGCYATTFVEANTLLQTILRDYKEYLASKNRTHNVIKEVHVGA